MSKFPQFKKWKNQVPTQTSENLKKDGVIKEVQPTKPEHLTNPNSSQYFSPRASRTKSRRTIQVATKLTPEMYELLLKIAYEKRWKLVEALEEALTCLSKELNIS